MISKVIFRLTICLLMLVSPWSYAQQSPETAFASPWIATIEGEADLRALSITKITKSDTGYSLDATMGTIGQGKNPLKEPKLTTSLDGLRFTASTC